MCDIVVKKFTFVISSPDEFLFLAVQRTAQMLSCYNIVIDGVRIFRRQQGTTPVSGDHRRGSD